MFDPPEARDPNDGARFVRLLGDAAVCTPEGLTLLSLLSVTVPITLALSFMFAPVVLPSTVLIAYAFWHFGRRVTKPGAMVAYCFAAGALAGVVNGWSTVIFWALFSGDQLFAHLGNTIGLVSFLGAGIGLAYGTAYLLPMLIQTSTRALRRAEAIDRCLIGYGVWGMLVLFLGLGATIHSHAGGLDSALDLAVFLALGSLALHASMFGLGVLRSSRRKWWLARVKQGKVPGWLVCEQERFHSAELAGLEVFCRPLFLPPYSDDLQVLARGELAETRDAYRTIPIAPRFLVV